MLVGDVYYLGGIKSHRNITALTIGSLVADTDYTLEPIGGKVTALTDWPSGPIAAAYGYTDPDAVSMLSQPAGEYLLRYNYINKADKNKAGTVEFLRVRFDPPQNLDFQSDELQIMDLTGSLLANTAIPVTDVELGQFGRRMLA
jgi:hypothetical protein